MKLIRILLVLTLLLLAFGSLAGQSLRTVNPLIQPQWHQTNPWNARCPGVGQNRAHAGSHALALAKTMKYWAYPTYGTGTVSYVDDDFGNLSQNLGVEINWDGMSNTLIFQTTQRFIYTCGLATYTNYEYDYSTSSLANVRSALINFYSYDDAIQQRDRDEYTNFYWKSLIRTELDNARPVIYAVTLANNREIAFIVDGYDEAGLFHVNFSNVNLMDAWVDLNNLAVQGEEIPESNQQMLTGIRPSLGPVDISENFEEGFGNWNWQFSGNANWTISTEAAYYGSSSAKSGNIDDNQVTSMYITINVTRPDTISFYKKVSCEAEPNDLYDHLAFFIDGVEQERWSGDGNWEYHEYPVTPGVHEFRWRYLKDGASDYFGDCAWVDAITFPEGTTPLGAPRFAEAEVINGNDIRLDWMPPDGTNPGLLGYKIFRNGVEIAQFLNPAMATFFDYNMPNGDYSYFLRAVYSEGVSNPGNSTNARVEVPYAPENLVATLQGINTARLHWDTPPNLRNRALMGFQIYRDNLVIAQVENPDANQYDDANLPEGVYYYEVTAMYATGESARSNMAQIAIGVPEPPANFRATVSGDDVSLAWNQVADTEFLTGFKIYRNNALVVTITDPAQLAYIDQNLPNGQYSYFIKAVYGDVDSGNSSTVTVRVEVPYPPVGLSATVNGDDVTLNWVNPETVRALTHYYIYRNNQLIAAVFNPNTTLYTDQNLANGLYTYAVSAVYSGVESAQSAPVTALVEVLYPPRNLSALVNLADVSLTWQIPVTQGGLRSFNGYNLYRNNSLVAAISNPSQTSYLDQGVPNGIYTYELSAVYTMGESSRIGVPNVTVEVLYPITQINYQIEDDDIVLAWAAPATMPSGRTDGRALLNYNIYRGGSLLASTTDLTYRDANLANGWYQYFVTALYSSGESEPSPTLDIEVEVLYPPTDLQAVVDQDDVNLSWTAPINSGGLGRGFLGYQLYRDGALIASPALPAYTDANLANGFYEYQVYAVYAGGISEPTSLVQALVEVLYPPRSLSHQVLDRNDVSLSWQMPLRTGGLRPFVEYQLYRNDALLVQTTDTGYLDADLADGNYQYYVVAVYGTGTSLASNSTNAIIEYPYPPANLQTAVNGADVTVSWDQVMGTEVRYLVYRDDVQIATTGSLLMLDSGLANGTYQYYVRTGNGSESGLSDPSDTVAAVVDVPYPPRMLSGTVNGDDISLVWQAPATASREVLSYNVYRDGLLIDNVSDPAYADMDLANGIYDYYVTAVHTSGESVPSNSWQGLVELLYPATALNAVVTGDDVALSWTAAVTSGGLREFQGYKVYRDALEIAQVIDTSYNDLNLANGVYDYYVKAVYGTGLSAASNTATAIVEVLYPPTQLSYQVSDDDILLSWQAAATSARGFLGYKLYRDGSLLAQTSSLTYTDASLANGTYSYYVTALYDSGESSASNTVVVNLEVLYPATALSAVVVGDDVALSWTAAVSSGGLRALLGYKVLRDGIEIGQTLTTSYDDLDLENGTYYYTVIASYSSGDSEPCPEAMAFVEVLYPATNLSYQVINDSVVLAWTAAPNSNRALQNYNIYRDDSLLAQTTDTVYTDAGLANGIYTYYVKANYITGESVPTNSVTATVEVLYPPTQLTYSVSDDDVSLYWQAAATSGGLRNLLGYKIYRDGSFLTQIAGLTYTDAALTNGTYSYYVTALYDSGESTPTNTVTALVEVLYPATALNAVVTGDDVALSWTAAVTSGGLREFQGYKVYRDALEIAQVIDTSYNDLNLANGVYDYYVKAVYGTGLSAASNTATAIVEVLYPPTQLSYQVSDDDILLSWQAAATSARGFLGYKLYRDGSLLAQTSSLTYTDASLANGTYSYYVTALYDSGESSASNTVNATIEITYPVTALTASVDEDAVTLSWTLPATAPIRAFRGYFIYRNGNLHQVLDNPALTSWTDQGLANGSYSYWLLAVYDAGLSIQSNTVTIEINVMPDLPAPVGFTAVLSGERDVTLSWQAPPINPQFYRIYRNAVEIATTESTIYQDLALPNGNYDYYVKAQYALGLSSASETATINIMIADPPANLTASLQDGNDVVLAWLAPSQGEIGYVLYRNNQELAYISNPFTLSYIDYDRPNGTYSYRVAAVYSSVISVPGNIASIQVELAYPAQNLVLNQAGNNISLSWTAPNDQGGFQTYRVYRNGSLLAQTTAQSYQDNNLANGAYSYYLTAVYSIGESQPTATQNATIQIAYTATALEAQVIGDDVTLSWTAPVDTGYLQSYNILRDGIVIAYTATTSYHDNNLANGSYSYAIVAVYSFGDALPSNYVNIGIELLYPPTGLVANVIDSDVHLSWTAPVNQGGLRALTGYKIYRNGNLLAQSAVTSYTDEDLANGTYSYHIVASYNSGDSAPGNTQEVLIEVLYPASNLVATATSDDIDLSWDAVPPSGASLLGYKIYRNGLLLAQTALTTYTDQNLNNGSYSYRIAAIYASGESAQSNEASATIMIPYIPTGFTVQMVGVRTAQLSWILPGQSETGFTLYKNGAFLVQITNPQGTVYLDQNLANGEYAYQIRADYPGISSELSAPVGVTVLNAYAPQNLTFNQAGNAVTLNWNPPTDIWGLNSYSVYRNEELLVSGSFTSYVDENLPNNWYTYYVVARYGTAVSPHSNSVNVHIVVPYPATNLTGTIDSNNVSLSWLPSSDLHGFMFYHIFCNNQQIGITNETTYQHTNLPNGSYTYHVTAVYSGGDAPPTNDYTADITLPYPPQAAFAVAGDDQIIINWGAPTDVTGLTGYRLYANDILLSEQSELFYHHNNPANNDYTYSVEAIFGAVASPSITTNTIHWEKIYSPSGLVIELVGTDISLGWQPVSDTGFFVNYKIYQNDQLIDTSVDTSFIAEDLTNGVYNYKVTASYLNGESTATNTETETVLIAYPPSNLTGSITGNSLSLDWDAPVDTGLMTQYLVYRNDQLFTALQQTETTILNLPNGSYDFFVVAEYQSGLMSLPTNTFTADIIMAYPPRNLTAVATADSVEVSWQAPVDTNNLTGYRLVCNGNPLPTIAPDALSFTHTGLANGAYIYQLFALYSGGAESYTGPVSTVVIKPYPVQNLVPSVEITSNTVYLSWDAPVDTYGLTGYRISRDDQMLQEINQRQFFDPDLGNGTYLYKVEALYGDLVSPPATTNATVFVVGTVPVVNATVVENGYLITWEAPNVITPPDYYEIFFLMDGMQNQPELWVTVAICDTVFSFIDSYHGGIEWGEFVWAVQPRWAGGDSNPTFSNILHIEMPPPPPPTVTKIVGNFPNPFNPHTNIVIWLKQPGQVVLKVYNLRGQLVRTLVNTPLPSGEHTIAFDGKDDDGRGLPSGVYVYRLDTKGYHRSARMILNK